MEFVWSEFHNFEKSEKSDNSDKSERSKWEKTKLDQDQNQNIAK